jgi:hypothetical protein
MKTLLFSCVVGLVLAGLGPLAQARPAREPAVAVKVVRGKDGKKTFVFGKMVLYGKAHQPHAVLMLDRERDLYRAAVPRKTLVSRIPDALRSSPF